MNRRIFLLALALASVTAPRLPAPIVEQPSIASPTQTPTPKADASKLPEAIPVITPEIAARIESKFCSWMKKQQFREFFDRQLDSQSFPVLLQARLMPEDKREFRAIFVKVPNPEFHFYAEWDQRPSVYEEKQSRLLHNGFEILSRQMFQDPTGEFIFQTVFVPKSNLSSAGECLDRALH